MLQKVFPKIRCGESKGQGLPLLHDKSNTILQMKGGGKEEEEEEGKEDKEKGK